MMAAVVTAGMVVGAVNKPVELIVPTLAVQLVAPEEVNCCVWPRSTDTDTGVMLWPGLTRVMEAVAEPFGPVAVTETAEDAGMVVGAV